VSGWFGVKTLYRWEAFGEPRNVDRGFEEDSTMFEERVVLVRANSIDQAIERAENEAAEYANRSYKNFYGQTVQTRYLCCCDAYEIGEELIGEGVEIYSSVEKVHALVEDSVLIDNRLGKEESITDRKAERDKFWNAELL